MTETMCSELANVGELLEAQVSAGQSRADVIECLFRSWMSRLSTGPAAGAKQKAALTQAITNGPWTADQRKDLASAVLHGGSHKNAASKARRPNQKAHKFENLVPMSVMLKLKDTTKYSTTSRLSIVAGAARSLGLEIVDNKTLYRMVALVAYQEGNYDMSQDTVWQHMTTLQTFLQSSNRVAVEFLEEYPPTAVLLPNDIQQSAYGSGELPPELNLADLDTVLGDNKMRGGRRLSGKFKTTGSATVDSPMSSVQGIVPSNAPAVLASDPAASSVLPSAQCFRFRADSKIIDEPKPQAPKVICESCSKVIPAPDHDHENAENDLDDDADAMAINNLSAFEQSMVGAYAVRKKPGAKSEPTTKASAKGKSKPKGKAKAKASTVGSAMKLVLGCGKCRGAPGGCLVCRNPAFQGKRGPACLKPKKSMKSMKTSMKKKK